jgi:hypothetical protein
MTSIAALGVGLAGLAGVLLAPIAGVHPAMGAEILTAAFVVVVIGGLGSFWGVIVAAMLVGVVRGITIYFNPSWGEASMYLLMALVLLLRPRGSLRRAHRKIRVTTVLTTAHPSLSPHCRWLLFHSRSILSDSRCALPSMSWHLRLHAWVSTFSSGIQASFHLGMAPGLDSAPMPRL